MRIVVLVKHVPEPTATWRLGEDHSLDRAAVAGRLSELDEYPVEQAVRLVEGGLAAEITYLTMGPAKATEALRKALAIGGDRAVHVLDDALHGSDAVATSLVLARAVERAGFDLVLCGMAATDGEMSVIPAMVADRLGVPQLTNAYELRIDDGTATVLREADDAVEEVVGSLPALVSITDRAAEARYPAFKSIMASKKKPVATWSLADLGVDPGQVGAAGAGTVVRSVSPKPPRQAGTVVVDDGTGAARLADFLVAGKFI